MRMWLGILAAAAVIALVELAVTRTEREREDTATDEAWRAGRKLVKRKR